MRKIALTLNALILLACASAAVGQELLQLTPGFARSVVVNGATAGNFTAIVGDPKVADFTFGPRNMFWFVGLSEGTTNVIVVDNATGREMYHARIMVGDLNRVHLHNKVLLNSYTVYRCTPRCVYVNETTVAEPAPLPRGHQQWGQTIRQNIQSQQSVQSSTVETSTQSNAIRTPQLPPMPQP